MATQGDKAPARPALKRSTVGLSAEDVVFLMQPDTPLFESAKKTALIGWRRLYQF